MEKRTKLEKSGIDDYRSQAGRQDSDFFLMRFRNAKNKRFILKNLNENFKFSRYEHSFIWPKEAGVALPAYCAQEPVSLLILSKSTNLFKLFASDVGSGSWLRAIRDIGSDRILQ